jgi:hypothetical protein
MTEINAAPSGKMHFMLWSAPPRPTFRQDMTEERDVMMRHVAYASEMTTSIPRPPAYGGLGIFMTDGSSFR